MERLHESAVPYPFRNSGAGTDEDLVRRCADALADAIRDADPETVAAVIVEPVQGAGGCVIPPLGWLARVRDICDDLEVLMIADEVITGFGRTGKWFGVQHEDVVPDLMSVAKGITSGYLPLSASIARAKIADAFDEKEHRRARSPRHLCGTSGLVRGGARQPRDHRARESRGERGAHGRAPARERSRRSSAICRSWAKCVLAD